MELTKSQNRILDLAKKGGDNADLRLLDEIDALERQLEDIKTTFEEKIAALKQEFTDSHTAITDNLPDLDKVLESVRGTQGEQGIQGEKGEPGEIGPQGEQGLQGIAGKNGVDGKDGIDGKDSVVPGPIGLQGNPGNDGKDGSPDSADDIRNKLEILEGEERLSITAIKGINELEVKMGIKITEAMSRIAPRSSHTTRFTDLSAQTNGSLKVFSVPEGLSGVLFSSDFPMVLMERNGFTLNASRTQLTMTTATPPSSGSQLLYQSTDISNS